MAFHSAASGEGASLTLSSHAANDLILLFVYRDNSNAAPTVPSGWTLVSSVGNNTNFLGVYWRRATSSSETSGTWTNATHLACWVGRSSNYLIPGTATVANGSTTTIPYSALTAIILGGATSVLVGAAGVRTNITDAETAPSGMTNRTSVAGTTTGELTVHDTGSAVSSWPLTNVVASGAVNGRSSVVVEVKDTTVALVAGSASSIHSYGSFT